jgi:hypothetical protein
MKQKFTDSDVVYMCETILGYLDSGRIDEAKQHLENLQHWFIDLPEVNSKLSPPTPLKTKPEDEMGTDNTTPIQPMRTLNTKPEIEKIEPPRLMWKSWWKNKDELEYWAREITNAVNKLCLLSTKDKKEGI